MKFNFRSGLILLVLVTACGTNPAPTAQPVPLNPPGPTTVANATETTIAQRFIATLTGQAPPAPGDFGISTRATVTPPPSPGQASATAAPPTLPPPTLSSVLSPSVTPLPQLPTRPRTAAPTRVPTQAPVTVSRDALLGKIMFKSTRPEGRYPGSFQYYVMDPDGSNVQMLNKGAAAGLYAELKPLEGYSPDRQLLVLGEKACGPGGRCDLYVGPPETIRNRSQGIWTPAGRGYRADNPVWSPDGTWVTFVWNRDNERTKNIFKGMPLVTNQDFKRLTDFGGRRDTKDPSYSPDGSQVVFATQDGDRWQLWILDATAENFTDANAHNLSNSSYFDWDPLWIK